MATGSGLDGQIGFATESVWGTAATVTRFLEVNSESLKSEPEWLESSGLRAGTKYKRTSRAKVSRRTVDGDVELEWATKGMGMLVKHMLGSTVTNTSLVSGGTLAFQQIHTPGDFRSLGLTAQVGRPEPGTGVVQPFTYSGLKVGEWEFSLEDNAAAMLSLTFDGRAESTATALATASYLAGSSVFDFSQAQILLGGTPATASGETTVTGGSAPATLIRSISIAGESPKETERFGLGSAGLKSEQLENDIPVVTGSLEAEFGMELFDVYTAGDPTALQLVLTGDEIETGNNFEVSFILPSVLLKSAAPSLAGPDLVQMSTDFEAYSNEADPVIQIKIVSTEATII